MTVLQFLSLYLFPWVLMIGTLVVIGFVGWVAERLARRNFRRAMNLVGALVLAPEAYLFLDTWYKYDSDKLPLYLQFSLASYATCGALLGVGVLVTIFGLFSEQVDNFKRDLATADRLDP